MTARILLVDDDADLRELLALALSRDGWETAQAGDAEGGLSLLRQGGFDLLITDYELPDKTGGQLLTEAARERLLGCCAVLVVTGHPGPEDVGAAPVIRKPFDVDALREQVRHILQRSPRVAPPETAGPGVELVLYVARGSHASRLAERNVRRILESAPAAAHARLVVRDVAEHPAEAERDRILFVPTLVARCTPPIWMVGSLRNPAALLGALSLCAAGDPGPAA
jgi:two-component system chemotaxis response regulator CheY